MKKKAELQDEINELVQKTLKNYDKEQKTLQYCSIEVYQESTDYKYQDVIRNICTYINDHGGSYAIMLHDKDIYNENAFDSNRRLIGLKGHHKKNHFHCLVAFKHRVSLNDISIAFGVEDRWIKILKHDYDFDNLIVYCTHIKYLESEKHHYPVENFNTNIMDYCRFLYDLALKQIEDDEKNICTFVVALLDQLDCKTSVRYIMSACLLQYSLNEFNKYYRIIKDLIFAHNEEIDCAYNVEDKISQYIVKRNKEKEDRKRKIDACIDSFGCTTFEDEDGTQYVIQKVEKKGKK